MPPKASSGKEKDIANEDDVLQAVILADSFNKRFKPLTVGKPRVCLLPLSQVYVRADFGFLCVVYLGNEIMVAHE